MRLPKKGFVNVLRKKIQVINVRNILTLVESKKLDASVTITKEHLEQVGLIKNKAAKVKLIMGKDNVVPDNIKITVDIYSEKAKAFSL